MAFSFSFFVERREKKQVMMSLRTSALLHWSQHRPWFPSKRSILVFKTFEHSFCNTSSRTRNHPRRPNRCRLWRSALEVRDIDLKASSSFSYFANGGSRGDEGCDGCPSKTYEESRAIMVICSRTCWSWLTRCRELIKSINNERHGWAIRVAGNQWVLLVYICQIIWKWADPRKIEK